MIISTVQFASAKTTFNTITENKISIDDTFITDYITMLKYHIEKLETSEDKRDHDCDILKLLRNNLTQAIEKPEETKMKWNLSLGVEGKPVEETIEPIKK